jgi:uncharacterized protein
VVAVGLAAACAGDASPPSTVGGTSTASGASGPARTASPVLSSLPESPPSSGPGPGTPVGFGTIAGRVLAADGTVCEVCLWRAADPSERRRGLMEVTDLGRADGMAFVYPEPTTTRFTMQSTLLALSIAFFDAHGDLIDAFDMEPCRDDPCPSYPTPEGFSVAVEVPRGGLADLGIGPGSRLELIDEACVPAG